MDMVRVLQKEDGVYSKKTTAFVAATSSALSEATVDSQNSLPTAVRHPERIEYPWASLPDGQ
jgi:hypothetical protein